MLNMQACASCLNGVKKKFQKNKNKIKFHACKFITSCHDENVIHDSTIQGEKLKN